MTEKASFEQLLATVGNGDVEKLKAKRVELHKQKTGLQEKLGKVSKELQEVEGPDWSSHQKRHEGGAAAGNRGARGVQEVRWQ
ncbi:MAG: hypothetical protein Q8Q12_06930 [bacterium]|nr:hypothetical protein [bacterium]